MKALGYTVTTITFIFLAVLWSGYALSILWAWFIVPMFLVPEINIPTAIGLAMIVSYLSHQDTGKNYKGEKFSDTLIETIVMGFLRPAFALLFGWVVTLFL